MLDLLFDAWRTDTQAGRSSLMLVADTQTVADLNQRARAHRVRSGQVAEKGISLSDGTTAGVGDLVVTRLNQRALTTGHGWVKNGDNWTVTEVHKDGSMTVTRAGAGTPAVLPADYGHEYVELGYASTAHRAQGRTVDTAHAYVTSSTLRESLYVMASRGRQSNMLYVDGADGLDGHTNHATTVPTDTAEVLARVIATSGADEAASTARRREQDSLPRAPLGNRPVRETGPRIGR